MAQGNIWSGAGSHFGHFQARIKAYVGSAVNGNADWVDFSQSAIIPKLYRYFLII